MNVISFLFVFFFRVFFYFQWKIEFVPSWRGKGPIFYMTIDVNRLLLQWRVGVQYSGCIKRGGGKYWSHQKAKFDGETKERGSFVNFISHFFFFCIHFEKKYSCYSRIFHRKLKGFFNHMQFVTMVACRKIFLMIFNILLSFIISILDILLWCSRLLTIT